MARISSTISYYSLISPEKLVNGAGIRLKSSSLRATPIGIPCPIMSNPLYKILLVDDHQLMSDGLKEILEKYADLSVCGQVDGAPGVLPAIHSLQPDLVLLDINLRGTNGIDVGRQILTSFPAVKVMMLTMYDHTRMLNDTRRAGLHGYMLKDSSPSALIESIRAVLRGEKAFDKRVQPDTSSTDAFGDDFTRRLNLTLREVEIIRLIRAGCTTEQIADKLHIAVDTVKTHRKNIHTKLGLTNVVDLVQWANRNGL